MKGTTVKYNAASGINHNKSDFLILLKSTYVMHYTLKGWNKVKVNRLHAANIWEYNQQGILNQKYRMV